MRSYASVALTACLFTNVFASKNFIAGYSVLRAEDVLARPYSELMGPRASTPLIVGRGASVVNAAAGPAEGVMLNNNGTLNVTAWNVATNDACIKALQPLSRSTNPSGNCICYNLPSLDTKTGIFEADLRLYRISQPRDNFANIPPENVKVGLEYHGASVSPISANDLMGMGQANRTSKLVARDAGSTPRLVQTYMFVGQIDQTKLKDNMSM